MHLAFIGRDKKPTLLEPGDMVTYLIDIGQLLFHRGDDRLEVQDMQTGTIVEPFRAPIPITDQTNPVIIGKLIALFRQRPVIVDGFEVRAIHFHIGHPVDPPFPPKMISIPLFEQIGEQEEPTELRHRDHVYVRSLTSALSLVRGSSNLLIHDVTELQLSIKKLDPEHITYLAGFISAMSGFRILRCDESLFGTYCELEGV